MKADERLSIMLSDYRLKHGYPPRRITMSAEVARELEAIIEARISMVTVKEFESVRLRQGRTILFQDVPVVADIDSHYVLDMR